MLSEPQLPSCPIPSTTSTLIRLGHGSGGKLTSNLIESIFLPHFGNEYLALLDDAALVDIDSKSIAITTDSYVVSPIFFPGGDIGSLSIHGTINDLAMRGARPLFISAAFILEEGFAVEELQRVVVSMANACNQAHVKLVAADTKVVGKGAADKVFITTTGVGVIEHTSRPAANRLTAGDCIVVNGDLGRHGMSIMVSREELELETDISSDSAPLHEIVQEMLGTDDSIHCMRDITRGGLASVLNELAAASGVGIEVQEDLIPIDSQVNAVCELLGLDPLYVACEGRFVTIAPSESVAKLLPVMNRHPLGRDACVIGRVVTDHPSRVVLRSKIGGNRILDKLSGEQLPRIC